MPEYRRAFQPGGVFFFTVVTNFRRPLFNDATARRTLRGAIDDTRRDHPFAIDALVLLPDHIHAIWTLPNGDTDFSTRWRIIKARFSHRMRRSTVSDGHISKSRRRQGERSYWQRRFWEHTVRDEADFQRLCDYIHYNPVKHGHVECPHAWPYSTFAGFVRAKFYESSWNCCCGDAPLGEDDDFSDLSDVVGE